MHNFLFVFCLFFSSGSLIAKNRSIVVAFGVPKTDPEYEELKFPNDDVIKFTDPLKKKGWEVFSVLDATIEDKRTILASIEEMNLTENDQLIIYFSGHGRVGNDNVSGEQYLLFKDSKVGQLEDDQTVRSLADWMQDSIVAKRKALILSACNAGYKKIKNIKGSEFEQIFYSFAILSASQPTGKAHEVEILSSENEKIKGCLFTHLLVKTMDNSVGLVEAYSKAIRDFRVIADNYNLNASAENKIYQTPHSSVSNSGVTTIYLNPDDWTSDEDVYFTPPRDYISQASINGVSIKEGKSLGLQGSVIVSLESKGKKIEKLVAVEKGKTYSFETLLEMTDPENSLLAGAGPIHFENHMFPSFSLTFKRKVGLHRLFARSAIGFWKYPISAFDETFEKKDYLSKLEIGTEYPIMISKCGKWDVTLSGQGFATHIHSQQYLDPVYFGNEGKAWMSMPGAGVGGSISIQKAIIEVTLEGKYSQHFAESVTAGVIDLSIGFGGMW